MSLILNQKELDDIKSSTNILKDISKKFGVKKKTVHIPLSLEKKLNIPLSLKMRIKLNKMNNKTRSSKKGMSPCKKCLENSWKYEYLDGWIRATCGKCGYEVEFESKKRKKNIVKQKRSKIKSLKKTKRKRKSIILAPSSSLCKHCGTQLIWKSHPEITEKELKRPYYFSKWEQCPKCRAIWHHREFMVKQKPNLIGLDASGGYNL